MNKMRCLLVDDEEDARYVLANYLEKITDVEIVSQCSGVEEAVECYTRHHPDVVFLDIRMPQQDGFALVKKLHALRANPLVVFSTAYDEYAIKALRTEAFDYILKPIDPIDLQQVVQRLRIRLYKRAPKNSNDKVRINTRTGYLLIPQEEIIYLKADGNYTNIMIDQARNEVSSFHLGKIEKQLTLSSFVRLGRSVIVNAQYLYKVDRNKRTCMLVKDGVDFELEVPDQYLVHLEKQLK